MGRGWGERGDSTAHNIAQMQDFASYDMDFRNKNHLTFLSLIFVNFLTCFSLLTFTFIFP